jgi:hypothetical protein
MSLRPWCVQRDGSSRPFRLQLHAQLPCVHPQQLCRPNYQSFDSSTVLHSRVKLKKAAGCTATTGGSGLCGCAAYAPAATYEVEINFGALHPGKSLQIRLHCWFIFPCAAN